jgi:hypothetical protein
LSNLKAFFKWLADKPGYKSRSSHTDAEYFNLSEKETRIARKSRDFRATAIPSWAAIQAFFLSL